MKSFHNLSTLFAATLFTSLSFGAQTEAAEETNWANVKQAIVVQGEGDTAYLAFSPEALRRVGKRPVKSVKSSVITSTATTDATIGATDLSATESRTISQWVKPRGTAQLYLQDNNDPSILADNLQINFVVPSGAVDQRVQITMTVYGNYLSDLVIAFQPGGLVFNTAAELQIGMGGALVDVDASELAVWHEYGDGTVEETTISSIKTYNDDIWFAFDSLVPGFSRYGIRR